MTGPAPTPLVPGIPTVAESGVPGFRDDELVGHPRAGRNPAADRDAAQHGADERSCSRSDVKDRFADLGVDAATSTPADFAAFIKTEVAKYAKLIQQVGVKVE